MHNYCDRKEKMTFLRRIRPRSGRDWILLFLGVMSFIAFVTVVCLLLAKPNEGVYLEPSVLGNYSRAAVAVDGKPCAKITKDVLLDGGSAVDAAIAGLLCNGVYNPQSMGLGGGFLMTIYEAKTQKAYTLVAREKAPLAVSKDMFEGNPDGSKYGALAVAVPGELAGYWEAKRRFGNPNISWQRLFQPTIDMCRSTGIEVGATLGRILAEKWDMLDPALKSLYTNPATGDLYQAGDIMYRKDLANTLEVLAKDGDKGIDRFGFYTGQLGANFVQDISSKGGIITLEDLQIYRAEWMEPVQVDLQSLGMTMYSVPPPGSGIILGHILNILDELNMDRVSVDLLIHRMAEAFKWAYGARTQLGDPLGDPDIAVYMQELIRNLTSDARAAYVRSKINDDFTVNNATFYTSDFVSNPDDHGTAHLSVLSENGDAVSATSTINLYFGANMISGSTGIICNDEMDDFSYPNMTNYFGVPPSPNNFPKPGKRPLSSMCPAVLVDNRGRARLVIGAAGGTKITTSVAQSILLNLWRNQDIKSAIDARRIHHQLFPMEVSYEPEFPEDILDVLRSRGHKTEPQDSFGSVVCGVHRSQDGRIYANADFRKNGGVDGY